MEKRQGPVPVGHGVDHIAVFSQTSLEYRAQGFIILGYENSHT
jgi:hypothetical protein